MIKYLILVVLALVVIVITRAIRVFELSSDLKGDDSGDHKITTKDNRMNAGIMLVFVISFFLFVVYQLVAFSDFLLPEASSEHGLLVDKMLNVNWVVILAVFFITNGLLFGFGYKYYKKKNRKAVFYPHNNKLEMLWTVVPAIVLFSLIIYGLTVWSNIMNPEYDEEVDEVNLYAKQFDWTVRYPGDDDKLGKLNFNLITPGINELGIITKEEIDKKLVSLDDELKDLKALEDNYVMEDSKDLAEDKVYKKERHITRLQQLRDVTEADTSNSLSWGYDDVIVKELHLVVNKPVRLVLNSRDVIHSAFLPHFRAQMNCVPGMTTEITFKPIKTTEQMKVDEGEDFEYVLLCNKICGSGHYNMKLNVIVETQEEFDAWMNDEARKTFKESLEE